MREPELLRGRRADRHARREPIDPVAMQAVDAANLPFLLATIDGTGWPGRDRVGPDGAEACRLLVQHAPAEHQERRLPLLEAAVATGQAELRHLAYLGDRVALHRGEPQRHGTLGWDIASARLWPVADPAAVPALRPEAGIEPPAPGALARMWTFDEPAAAGLPLRPS